MPWPTVKRQRPMPPLARPPREKGHWRLSTSFGTAQVATDDTGRVTKEDSAPIWRNWSGQFFDEMVESYWRRGQFLGWERLGERKNDDT